MSTFENEQSQKEKKIRHRFLLPWYFVYDSGLSARVSVNLP